MSAFGSGRLLRIVRRLVIAAPGYDAGTVGRSCPVTYGEGIMAHAERVVTINRPAREVFDFILEGKNNQHWRPAVHDVAQVPGTPKGVGAIFKQGMKGPGGRRIDADYKIVEADPPRRIRFEVVAGPARPTGTYTFEAEGNATTVTLVLDYRPKGLAKLMDGMIGKQMQVEVATLDNLKSHLEGHPV